MSGMWTSLLRTVGYLRKEKGERNGTEMEEHDARNEQMTDHRIHKEKTRIQTKGAWREYEKYENLVAQGLRGD